MVVYVTLRTLLALLWLLPRSPLAFCPAGFGGERSFPPEWEIPDWPNPIPPDQAVKLRFVTLGGFNKPELNEEFLEGPTAEFRIGGRETYWQASGQYLLYFCQRFQKWRVASIDAFSAIKNGECFAYASDASPSRDIRNVTFLKGWIEVESGAWQLRPKAGVVALGTLADQLTALEEANKTSVNGADDECVADDGESQEDGDVSPNDGPFGKRKKPECPLKPAMRKAHAAVRVAAKAMGAWVRRLFPSLLPAPADDSCTWQLTGAKQFCTNRIEIADNETFSACQEMVLEEEQCENVMYVNARTSKCFCVPKGEACNVSSKASANTYSCIPRSSAPEEQHEEQKEQQQQQQQQSQEEKL